MESAYSREQIDQFLDHIGLPKELHHAPPSLSLLTALHIHTLAAVPYENLMLHYNPTHTVVLDPQQVFHKIVSNKRGRGGYCMEISIFYNHILRGLGFDAYTVGAKTRPRLGGVPHGDFPGWVHIVNIVTLPPDPNNPDAITQYADDVGFGGDGATTPLPLVPDLVHTNLGAQEVRLIRDWIPAQTHRVESSKFWIYQYRNGTEKPWNSFYGFTELEFTFADWECVNWWTGSKLDRSWQTWTAVVIKFLRRAKEGAANGEQEIYGKRMLVDGVVKENLGGKTQIIAEFKTEPERIAGLSEHFGIELTEEERQGIKGWRTELLPEAGA